jgi:hypothetical protein
MSKGAYLNGGLTKELYMKQPIGFEDGIGTVCRLVKPIYMLDFGCTRLRSIYRAYIFRDEERISFSVVWVDDMVGIANTKETECRS